MTLCKEISMGDTAANVSFCEMSKVWLQNHLFIQIFLFSSLFILITSSSFASLDQFDNLCIFFVVIFLIHLIAYSFRICIVLFLAVWCFHIIIKCCNLYVRLLKEHQQMHEWELGKNFCLSVLFFHVLMHINSFGIIIKLQFYL